MKKALLFISSIAILASCASYKPPKQYKFPKKQTFNLNYDVVWSRVVDWFGSRNTPIKNIDKSSGIITTEYNLGVNEYSNYCDCGKPGGLQHFEELFGNFNVVVRNKSENPVSDNKTEVTVNAFFKGALYGYNVATERYVLIGKKDCNSKGVLEKKLFNYIKNGR